MRLDHLLSKESKVAVLLVIKGLDIEKPHDARKCGKKICNMRRIFYAVMRKKDKHMGV